MAKVFALREYKVPSLLDINSLIKGMGQVYKTSLDYEIFDYHVSVFILRYNIKARVVTPKPKAEVFLTISKPKAEILFPRRDLCRK